MSFSLRSPTPIFVGISGHRDVRAEDLSALGRAIDDFFAQVRERYAHTDIVLLTGLASGADQLGATHAKQSGIPYVAVLPMPLDAYRQDFSPGERERFEKLLADSASRIELPLAANVTSETIDDPEARSHQYAALGTYLVAHSAILLALYNGKPIAARGGTSEVVAHAREDRPARHRTMKPFVYEISTPRQSDVMTHRPPFEVTGFDDADPALQALATIDQWNARAAGSYTFDVDLCPMTFNVADGYAIDAQAHTHRAINRVYLYTLASTFSLQLYDHLGEFVPVAAHAAQLFGMAFFGFIAAAIYSVSRIHADDVQNRFQDYRFLAEGLRVQLALLDAGIDINAATRYQDGAASDYQWAVRAIDVAYVSTAIASCRIPLPSEGSRENHPSWITDQRAYYERAAARNRFEATRANRIAVRWLRCSVVAGLLIALDGLLHFSFVESFGKPFDTLAKSATLLIFGFTGSLAAIVRGKSSLRGYGALASHYQKMYELFDDAYRHIGVAVAAGRRDRAETLFIELAEAALAEGAAWHSSERSRPLESMWGR